MTRIACALVAVLLLAGCGGGAEEEPAPAPTTTAPADETADEPTPEPEPTAADLRGTPAPEALSGFRCEKVGKVWKAVGTIENTTKERATFQVTLYIGPGDGSPHEATTQQLANVEPGGSVEFDVPKIPVAGEGPCRVQVLRSDG